MFLKQRTTEEKNERWVGIAKQLVGYLENFKKQQEFLREIDRQIIDSYGGELDKLLQVVVDQVQDLLPGCRASFYLIRGANAGLKTCSCQEKQPQKSIPLKELYACFAPWKEGTGLWERGEPDRCLLDFEGSTVLAVPARRKNEDLGMLVVETDQAVQYTQLSETEICGFLKTVAGQIAVALKYHEQLTAEARLWNFASKLYEPPFEPMEKLNSIARHFRTFLPECEEGCLDDDVYVQILFVEESVDGPVLTIRGSTDPDRNPGLTQINVAESVCGLLVTRSELPYVLCDPVQDEEYRGLYKGYFGKEAGAPIRCELAIALTDSGGERFAVLNLESTQPNAFSQESVSQYIAKAKLFSPIIASIKSRIKDNALAQASTLQVLETYLDLVSRQYRHSLRTPHLALKEGLVHLREKLDKGEVDLEQVLKHIQGSVADIYTLQFAFASDLNDFASPKHHDLAKLLEDALRLFNRDALRNDNNITFESKFEPGIQVECSLFMKQGGPWKVAW